MLVQFGPKSQDIQSGHSPKLESNLGELVNILVSKNGQKIFKFLELDSSVGFKIQLKFSKNQMLVSGTLQHINGSPFHIPEIYQNSLIETIQRQIKKLLTFQYVRQFGTLCFQSGLKLDSSCSDPLQLISNHLSLALGQTPKIYDLLILFGLVKKKNLNSLRMKSKRLAFLTKIASTLSNQEQPKETFLMKSNNSSVFKKIENVVQTELNFEGNCLESNESENIKKGGYFEVEKKNCQITIIESSGSPAKKLIMPLAVKQLKKSQSANQNCQNKIQKQLKILNQITDSTFNINYWVQEKNQFSQGQMFGVQKFDLSSQKLYMDFVEESLDDYIYGHNLNLNNVVHFSNQIVSAVGVISECGVVHRDLKPDNLLVSVSENKDGSFNKHIKIIDFGESSLVRDSFQQQKNLLGSTMPYSPIECYVSCEEGFNSTSIDRWSVGLILYELMFKKNPISYSRCFAADIYKGWKIPEEFNLFPNVAKKSGCRIIEFAYSILAMNSVCVNQKDRLSLYKMKQMMENIQAFMSQMKL